MNIFGYRIAIEKIGKIPTGWISPKDKLPERWMDIDFMYSGGNICRGYLSKRNIFVRCGLQYSVDEDIKNNPNVIAWKYID